MGYRSSRDSGSAGSNPRGHILASRLLFAIHDAEAAAYVWKEGSLHNSISYRTLNVTQTLVAISFELTIFMAAAAWATQLGASHLAIFTFAVLLGGYTAHGLSISISGGAPTGTPLVSQQRCRSLCPAVY